MAQRFSRAMEFMGWKVPEVEDDGFDETYEEEDPFEVQQVELHAFPGGVDVEQPSASPAPATPSLHRIVTVHPTSYGDARLIGEAYRDGIPVIINLTDLPEPEARRIVDFAAGLVFGLHGVIERVTTRVFLLSPASVEVSSKAKMSSSSLFS